MWTGGVRVIIPDGEGRILMVRQTHEGKDLWMVPGGGIEDGENSKEAALREVLEETGLQVKIKRLIWHIEEVSPQRGQRFVNFFLAESVGGELALGSDPEFAADSQVLKEVKFLSRSEIQALERVYPEGMKDALWDALEPKYFRHEVYQVR